MYLAVFNLLLGIVAAVSPEITFPFNAQVPPVARISEPFRFQFSPSTFKADGQMVQYSISGAPSWLSLDGPSRILWGTPGASDIGVHSFNVTATNAGGSAVMQATLIVVSSAGPQVRDGISDQLSQAGKLSGPTSIVFHQLTPFHIKFTKDTFEDNGNNLSYYATLSDHTPLPAWIAFDPDTLELSGTTPELPASPQDFEVLLIASDVVGFSAASTSFTLVVGSLELVFVPWEQTIHVSAGERVNINTLRSQLMLNGKPINDADIQTASAQIPPWLTFDPKTFAVTGTAPPDFTEQVISVAAYGRYGDTANTTIHLVSGLALFSGRVGNLTATIGEAFNYTISRSIFAQVDLKVTVDIDPAASWLHFESSTLELYGNVPSNVQPGTVEAIMTIQDPGSGAKDTQNFHINVVSAHVSKSTATALVSRTSSSTATAAQPSSEIAQTPRDSTSGRNKKNAAIITVVTVCLAVAVFGFVVGIIYCKRPKRWRNKRQPPSKPEISRPIIPVDAWGERGSDNAQDMEMGLERTDDPHDRPPQVDLNLSTRKSVVTKVRQSVGSTIADCEAAILADFNRSSWGYGAGASHAPHESMKVPTEIARRSRVPDLSPTRMRPPRSSCPPSHSARFPSNRRTTGLGHGHKIRPPTARTASTTSAIHPRAYNSCSTYTTESTDMLSTTPSAFAVPPSIHNLSTRPSTSSNANRSKSIRKVYDSPTATNPLPDRRTLHEKRQSYIRHRAATRSPFFSARDGLSSRASSQSRRRYTALGFYAPTTTTTITTTTESSNSTSITNHDFPDSLHRACTRNSVRRTYSASSSVEPPLRVRKRWSRHLRERLAEGYPRAVAVWSGTRNSLGSARTSRVFESADEEEEEGSSFYSRGTASSAEGDEADGRDGGEDGESGEAGREASFVLPGPHSLDIHPALRHRRNTTCVPVRPGNGSEADEGEDFTPDMPPAIDSLRLAAAMRNSGRASQQRRSRMQSQARTRRAMHQPQARGVLLGRMMQAGVRIPLSMVENRGVAGKQREEGQEQGRQEEQRGKEKGRGNGHGQGPKLRDSKGKRPVSVESGRAWGSLRGEREGGERGDEAFL